MATQRAKPRKRAIPHDAIQMRVPAGEPIPEPGSIFQGRSPLTGYLYAIRVRSLIQVAWATECDDIIGVDVWLRGDKQMIGDSAPDEDGDA